MRLRKRDCTPVGLIVTVVAAIMILVMASLLAR